MDMISRKILLPLSIILVIFSCFPPPLEATQHKMILIILPSNGFDEDGYLKIKAVFDQIRVKTVTASASLNITTGSKGGKIRPDIGFELVDPEQYDAVVLIGGTVSQQYWDNKDVHDICLKMAKLKRPIAAQGFAVLTLGKAGLLKDIRVAGTLEIKKYLLKAGALYTTKPIFKDELILTASAKADARQLGIALRKILRPYAYLEK